MTIARAMGAIICQLPGRSPGAAWTVTRDTRSAAWGSKYGG